MTKLELERISDADMYLFFEKCMRAWVSYISKRYSKANNKYLNSYDPKQGWKHIIYLNRTNFYGYAKSKFLPTNWFELIDPTDFNSNKYSCNSSKGCVFEVDLEYPKELHESYNGYPLAPDEIEIKIFFAEISIKKFLYPC